MAIKITGKVYAQCQILTTEPGMKCPLCDLEIKPNRGHYCTVRNGEVKVDDQKEGK